MPHETQTVFDQKDFDAMAHSFGLPAEDCGELTPAQREVMAVCKQQLGLWQSQTDVAQAQADVAQSQLGLARSQMDIFKGMMDKVLGKTAEAAKEE